MDNQDEAFLERLQQIFSQEAKEHVEHLAAGLLDLKKSRKGEEAQRLVETLFREAHSLKGASRSVNIPEIEEMCKAAEGVFGYYKNSKEAVPDARIDTMLEATDLLAELSLSDEEGRRALKPAVQNMIERIKSGMEMPEKEEATNAPSEKADVPPVTEESIPEAVSTVREKAAKKETPKKTDKKTAAESMREETIRVPVKKLNAIMLQTEEMLFAKMVARRGIVGLEALLKEVKTLEKATEPGFAGNKKINEVEQLIRKEIKRSKDDEREVGLMVDRLLEDLKQTLMLPFSTLFYALPKSVYDMAKSVGKEAVLEVVGGEIEIDRRILEEMRDPLIHLLRNAVDHGIETPEVRLKKGKPKSGTVKLLLSQKSASKVEIRVQDDGKGIDGEKLRDSAIRAGWIDREEARALEGENLLRLVFQSGVSTSGIVTDLSGRGLGLAIVQEKAERLGGEVRVKNLGGGGCEFSVLLPLTMATFRGVLTLVNGRTFIFPSIHVRRIIDKDAGKIKNIEGKAMVVIDHEAVAYHLLRDVLALGERKGDEGGESLVVIESGGEMLAIAVDRVLHEEEVMVKSLGAQLVRVRNIAGAARLASDKSALILNVSDLFKTVGMVTGSLPVHERSVSKKERKILVVEDSPTTRVLLQNILEMAGYLVVTAGDGLEAYEKLKSETVDLVVSDIDMPRMNGFELTESIRAEPEMSDLPVVLVTSLESSEDRERGMRAGANAYIVKSTFDQNNLMEKIRWLIE